MTMSTLLTAVVGLSLGSVLLLTGQVQAQTCSGTCTGTAAIGAFYPIDGNYDAAVCGCFLLVTHSQTIVQNTADALCKSTYGDSNSVLYKFTASAVGNTAEQNQQLRMTCYEGFDAKLEPAHSSGLGCAPTTETETTAPPPSTETPPMSTTTSCNIPPPFGLFLCSNRQPLPGWPTSSSPPTPPITGPIPPVPPGGPGYVNPPGGGFGNYWRNFFYNQPGNNFFNNQPSNNFNNQPGGGGFNFFVPTTTQPPTTGSPFGFGFWPPGLDNGNGVFNVPMRKKRQLNNLSPRPCPGELYWIDAKLANLDFSVSPFVAVIRSENGEEFRVPRTLWANDPNLNTQTCIALQFDYQASSATHMRIRFLECSERLPNFICKVGGGCV